MGEHFEGENSKYTEKSKAKQRESVRAREQERQRDREKERSKPKLKWYANQRAYHQIRSKSVISIMKICAKRKGGGL